mmetsp:Transcript_16814/g.37085  ORF Transcript_16814/g.37085 Transcript_16814/m.37085 type:complete len:293 (-) Transcript_16814:11-889(-)
MNARNTSSWMLFSLDHINARACFMPVNAQGRPKCLALTKNRSASVTSLGFEDISIDWKEDSAPSNISMKETAEDANFKPLTLARNSLSASLRSSESLLASASSMAAARAADSISSSSLSAPDPSPFASSSAAFFALRISSGTLCLKYDSISAIFSRYISGLRMPKKGLFSRMLERSCIAYLRTMTVLSFKRSIAISVTDMMRSKGTDCFSVRSLSTLRDAPRVKEVMSRVRSQRISKRALRVFPMFAICLPSSFFVSPSPSEATSPISFSIKVRSSRTSMCPIDEMIADLST